LNRRWHSRLHIYETGFCEKARICFGALYEGYFYAAAIWDNPTARSLPQHEWLELKRMAICAEAPKNTASRMLKIMTAIIKKRFPEIERLISYQDVEVHKGTIYKAAGWHVGHNGKSGSWGGENHKRSRPDYNNVSGKWRIRWEKNL
jgi:hypothetical protein